MRHPTRAAINRLNKELGLIEEPWMQDWELECADPNRVDEFLSFYEKKTESDDERFTLMALILGSFEDYHGLKESDESTWGRIREILERENELHRTHIDYYQCSDEEEDDCISPITRLMRQIELKPEPDEGGNSIRRATS
ncbi:hypothetical protein [Cerasicoccus frondis]|uniref:hypothetical protein n=1 Tax=Cerasicoccus frondis TaxID=490090 RepID=UPI002852CA18|nr:hypothetical protein [Cerasicoccus frondis]